MKTTLIFFCMVSILVSCTPNSSSVTKKTNSSAADSLFIVIQPLGKVSQNYLNEVKNALQANYAARVNVAQRIQLPEHARSPFASTRYRADTLLRFLVQSHPSGADKIIGLTEVDITTTKNKEPAWKYRDWGIFGLGQCPGKTCIVSTFRLGARNATKQVKLERLRKVAVHEVGHTMGLPHCTEEGCVMSDAAETIATIDHENENLCNDCNRIVFSGGKVK